MPDFLSVLCVQNRPSVIHAYTGTIMTYIIVTLDYCISSPTACFNNHPPVPLYYHTSLQEVVVHNDSACGSTIGPTVSAKLGLRTVDLGMPQLSMHSIREMCCISSVYQATTLYKVS